MNYISTDWGRTLLIKIAKRLFMAGFLFKVESFLSMNGMVRVQVKMQGKPIPKPMPEGLKKYLFKKKEKKMKLDNVQVCLDCEELYIGDYCPKCCSRDFFYLRKYFEPFQRF